MIATHSHTESHKVSRGASAISDDIALLDIMLRDMDRQTDLFKPGQYWRRKTRNSVTEITRFGLNNFRGYSNLIGESFADNVATDERRRLGTGWYRPVQLVLDHFTPVSKVFQNQVRLTQGLAQRLNREVGNRLLARPRTQEILGKYKLPDTMVGGCVSYVEHAGTKISTHYLNLLDTHDRLCQHVDFRKAKSFFEIGGGFGVNLHLLLENYNNIRKVVYLDIPPNLYVGTQYLKAFFGDSVRDYRATRGLSEISFKNDDQLEILCIAPWQIDRLRLEVDLFHNANSFVEMPRHVVQNYAKFIEQFAKPGRSTISLVTYDNYDPDTTIPHNDLPKFFSRKFAAYNYERLLVPESVDFFFIAAPN